MDTTTVALIASGIGATGAVAGQIVAQLFTGRRETKRLKWEGEQREWERQRDRDAEQLERARIFADIKRKAYVDFFENGRRPAVAAIPRNERIRITTRCGAG
ncbi:hypothetical protein OG394_34960 [Kribbella sp. NBC_01245]|uniref:hypothetical protein n=1 Tax=Kribbella sp. NBC_01245 TaxID=2903578 RepID=UPI002E2DC12B|nr:hypothetical protein [Kribbella sp. NBC_01245]